MGNLKDRVKEKTGQTEEQQHAEERSADLALGDGLYRWLEQRSGYFERALPAHLERQAPTFMLTALTHIRRNTALMRCEKDSLLIALIQAAHFGLLPDGKHCALVPYGKQARFIPMVEGLTDLMYRSGAVAAVRRGLIHEGDDWDITPTAPPPADFHFKPKLLDDRGEPILAYAFCWMRGGSRSEVITFNRAETEAHRDRYSKAYQLAEANRRERAEEFARRPDAPRFNSPWHTHFPQMWQKCPVRMLAKVIPTSPEMRLLLLADDAADSTVSTEPYRPVVPLDPTEWQDISDDEADRSNGEDGPDSAATTEAQP